MQNADGHPVLSSRELLAQLPSIFTVDDVRRTSGWDDARVWVETGRWVQRGWATRLRHGVYSLHIMGRSYPLDLLEALHLVQPSALAYWTALNYHHLTEQLPPTIVVQTPTPGRQTHASIRSLDVRIVRLQPSRFWGIVSSTTEDGTLAVTEPEKTVLDCLDRLELCGGIVEVAKALRTGSKTLSPSRMATAAQRFGSDIVCRRLLFLATLLGWHTSWLISHVPVAPSAGYAWLDPTAPRTILARSMRLYVNVAEEDIDNGVGVNKR
jgi:predicted transcriptional regulator of viral defense system